MAICILIPLIVGLICALLGYWLGKLKSSGDGGNSLNLKSELDASNATNSKLTHKISLLENEVIVAKSTLQNDLDACKSNSKKLNENILSLQNELDSVKSNTKASKANNDNVAKSFVSTKKPVAKKPVAKKPADKKSTKTVSTESSGFNTNLVKEAYGKKIKADDLKIVEGIGPKIEELYHKAGIKTWKALSETSLEKSQAILKDAGERFVMHNPGSWAKQALMAYEGKWAELKAWQEAHKGGKE